MQKTKMLVMYTTFQICGGVERLLLNFLDMFPEDRYQIDLALFDGLQDQARMFDMIPRHVNILPFLRQYSKWTPELMEELRADGKTEMADVKDFVHYRNLDEHFKALPIGDRLEQNWQMLKRIAPKYEAYDVAVAFTNTLPLYIVAECVDARKKFAIVHLDVQTEMKFVPDRELSWRAEAKYLARMDNIICITEQNTASLRGVFPELGDRIVSLSSINNSRQMIEQAERGCPPEYEAGIFNILTVARIHEQKGLELLLKGARRLKDRGVDFRWFVLGRIQIADYWSKCLELQEELGLVREVVFIGERPNPFPYYRHCDLYVQTSLFEGRCLALEEARILGCPIVSTDFSSVGDQIADGVNGRICRTDPASLAEAVEELYNDAALRDMLAMGNKGYTGALGREEYFELFVG